MAGESLADLIPDAWVALETRAAMEILRRVDQLGDTNLFLPGSEVRLRAG